MSKSKKVPITKDEQFFYEHAGYSHDPKTETPEQGRVRCAIDLAAAEIYAKDRDWTFDWSWDECGDLGDHSEWCDVKGRHDHYIEHCALSGADGNVLEALGGIIDADNKYRRVVQAELASQALYEINQRQKNDDEANRIMAL